MEQYLLDLDAVVSRRLKVLATLISLTEEETIEGILTLYMYPEILKNRGALPSHHPKSVQTIHRIIKGYELERIAGASNSRTRNHTSDNLAPDNTQKNLNKENPTESATE